MARSRGITQVSGLQTFNGPTLEQGSWTINSILSEGGTGTPSLDAVNHNYYFQLGEIIFCMFDIEVSFSNIDSSNWFSINAPILPAASQYLSGHGWYTLSTTVSYPLMVSTDTGTRLGVYMNRYRQDTFSTTSRWCRCQIMYRTTS
jgi:hypothetical protein